MDERLLIEAAQKDPSRFGELYEENVHRVYAFIIRRVRERQTAQDLTSEVFQQALANLPRFEWRGAPFAAWLYRIAANAVADHFQKTSREVAPPPGLDPAEETDIERRVMLFGMVDKLPAEQRRVIILRFAEGKNIREVAQQIGRSEGAVKQLQWRALQNLRAQMHG
ncbi:MAG TPA: sigma-70 family RNA polymerase sigma factor [Thermoanaerobaculia bacterium]|nr:sigma-70 family RNA polymerase sigma factor [Thermoanaerobaculia bacterium]